MKILLLCNKSPWPLREGGPIAMHAMITGLVQAGHSVKVLAMNTNKYSVDPSSLPTDFIDATRIEFVDIDLSVKPLPALYNYLSGQSYHVARFLNESFSSRLRETLQQEEFDIIQFETLFTTVYLDLVKKYSNARVVLRAHNIEHLIWQRIAENSKNPLKKHYLKHLYLTLKVYELDVINKMNGIVAITETDAVYFGRNTRNVPVMPVPFGINPDIIPQKVIPAPALDFFHIGSMNWIPNAEGIRWFLDKVWPVALTKNPELKLHLAGRMMPEWLVELKQPGVIIEGEVPDALSFMEKHAVMIVPLFSGSGIRIKIIEAMAAGRTVIATKIGAEGIEYIDGQHLFIANTPEEFTAAIEKFLKDPSLAGKMGSNARTLMAEKHDNRALITHLTDFYHRLSGDSRRPS